MIRWDGLASETRRRGGRECTYLAAVGHTQVELAQRGLHAASPLSLHHSAPTGRGESE